MSATRFVWDGLRNLVSGVGTRKDKSSHYYYHYAPFDREQIEAAFCSDWLARKIVTLKPKHMTREWRTWQATQAEALYDLEKKFRVKNKVRQALVWRNLYGGAAIYMGDGTPNQAAPLDIYNFPQDGLKTLFVFSRYDLRAELFVTDVLDPDYGKPSHYRVHRKDGTTGILIHRSRFVFLKGDERPGILFDHDGEWGQSVFDTILQAIINVNSSAANAAALMNEAKVDVITVPNLAAQLADKESTALLTERFTLANQLKSVINTLLLGEGETFERKQISFGGIPELIHTHFQTVAGAADIPMTVLIGQSPAGLNATGESDVRNFYDSISNDQENELSEQIDPLDEVLIRNLLGARPKEVVYEWNPLWQMSQAELIDIGGKLASAVTTLNNTGLLMPEELRPAAIDLIIASGFLPTLDQHLVTDEAQLEEFFNPEPVESEEQGNDPPANQRPRLRVVGDVKDSSIRTLYISRQVTNASRIIAWAREQGIPNLLDARDLHVTIAYSRKPVDWMKVGSSVWTTTEDNIKITGGPRLVDRFDDNSIVLLFSYDLLKWRWQEVIDLGGSWDYPDYKPHITIAKIAPDQQPLDMSKLEAYTGPIILGPEVFEELDEAHGMQAAE